MGAGTASFGRGSVTSGSFCACVFLAVCGFGQNVDRVRADIEFLSSDALQGRLSLDRGADVAAQFIAAEFRKAGLKPANGDSFLQPFPLIAYRPDLHAQTLTVVRDGQSRVLQPRTDYIGGFAHDVSITAPVVFAGYGIDYAGLDVRGKIVVILDHEPGEENGHTIDGARSTKVVNAQQHGALAVLVASEPDRKHAGLLDPPARTADGKSIRATAPSQALEGWIRIPAFSISDDLLKDLRSAPCVINIETKTSETHRGTSFNVAGLLEGSDPALKSETVLLTAHYDHLGVQGGAVYPGANDNASGTAGVIELARILTRQKRSILFVIFGSEEEGMLGSHYYCNHPLRPLESTRAVIDLDMIGRDEPDTSNLLNLVGTVNYPDLRKTIEHENTDLTLDTKFDRDHELNVLFRCDHFPFLVHHVAAVWFFGGFHPGYHEPSDTLDLINFAKMDKVIRLAGRTAVAIANR